jgi:hypothetical protein
MVVLSAYTGALLLVLPMAVAFQTTPRHARWTTHGPTAMAATYSSPWMMPDEVCVGGAVVALLLSTDVRLTMSYIVCFWKMKQTAQAE